MKRLILCLVLGIVSFESMEALAAPGVHPRNIPCIKFYNEWKKKPKHRAFAVATSSEAQACGGSWGHRSKEAAIADAKKWCKKAALENAACNVTKAE